MVDHAGGDQARSNPSQVEDNLVEILRSSDEKPADEEFSHRGRVGRRRDSGETRQAVPPDDGIVELRRADRARAWRCAPGGGRWS